MPPGSLLRNLAKRLIPAPVRALLRRLFGWRWFRGTYASWEEARRASGGYEDEAIVGRVLEATLAVREGRAAFERDSVLFPESERQDPLHRLLRDLLTRNGAGRRVLDFGGSLGSVYWRCHDWIPRVDGLAWDVVEQPAFVRVGQERLAGGGLSFFGSIGEAEACRPHDLFLCSTVLQYLEDPHAVLEDWLSRGWPELVFNNLPLHTGGSDLLRVQHVPPSIYPASYPVWFLDRARFLAHFDGRYRVEREYASEAVWPVGFRGFASTGFHFRRL
jgi:putative methyltransferase (TIGR04325 family)